MSEVDYNIENYTIEELLKLFSLKKNSLTEDLIDTNTNFYISKSKDENNNNMADFIEQCKTKLKEYLVILNDEEGFDADDDSSLGTSDEEYNEEYNDKVISNMEYDDPNFKNIIQPQYANPKNQTEKERITDRVEHTDIIGIDKHFVLKRKQLGVSDVMQVPVTQGILNPNLKNKISRIINIDSQYRQNISTSTAGSPTDFTIDLSEPVNDVVHMRLFSIQVPYTWYLIDSQYGTNFFYINNQIIEIAPGNYSLQELIDEINLITHTYFPSLLNFTLNKNNGKTTITTNSNNQIINELTITFFSNNFPVSNSSKIDNNLGYILGFRETHYELKYNIPIVSEAVGDNYGTKYFLIHVDDFNQNQMNTNVIGASDNPITHLNDPIYFARDSDFVKTGPGTRDIFIIPKEKKELTIPQLHSINEINKNRTSETVRNTPPTMKNMFGMVPIRRGDFLGPAFCENGGSLQSNERTYFGPVNISRLHVKLLDDKGNLVNLNGCNWSFSMVCETLYQY